MGMSFHYLFIYTHKYKIKIELAWNQKREFYL